MMSNSVEAARSMVVTQKETGKLCQIGHQRRSNPRYLKVKNDIINKEKLLGPITHCYAQWNRAIQNPMVLGWPKGKEISQDALTALGYPSMDEYRNWRWYKKYGGGPIADLGAHQIDLFSWIYGTTPTSIQAVGSNEFYDGKNGRPKFEHYDNVQMMYEYKLPEGRTAFASYQVLTTSSSQGIFEKFIGTDASVVIAENLSSNQLYKENNATWNGDDFVAKGLIKPLGNSIHHKFWEKPRPWYRPEKWLATEGVVDVRESKPASAYELAEVLNKLPHTPHLENFFAVVARGGKQEELPCTVLSAYQTCVSVLKANQAIQEGRKIIFDPAEFTV
jgi:predicted dehydrogenase